MLARVCDDPHDPVYRWELDGPAQQQFGDLSPAGQATLAAFLDAVVIVDPVQYQRRPDEHENIPMPRRTLHFGRKGWSRSWCIRPMISCSSSGSSGSASERHSPLTACPMLTLTTVAISETSSPQARGRTSAS